MAHEFQRLVEVYADIRGLVCIRVDHDGHLRVINAISSISRAG